MKALSRTRLDRSRIKCGERSRREYGKNQPCASAGRLRHLFFLGVILNLLAACLPQEPPPGPASVPLANELVLYNWADYMPQSVLEAFEYEFGTRVEILTYDSQEQALENLNTDSVKCDMAVIDFDLLPQLIRRNLIAEIDYRNIPNFKNISADFRDLNFDPGNRHSIPYHWGTSGLIVRSDLVEGPITKWADLWDARYQGKIAIRAEPTEIVSIALRSLDYPLNSEDPQQLNEALSRLLELKDSVVIIPSDPQSMLDALGSGQIAIVQGWNGDALVAREQIPSIPIQYVLPEEGTMLWGDTFVITSSSPNKYTAEVFLNFILRPEIGAQIVEADYYPSANEAAREYIDPKILNDPLVYPRPEDLRGNDFYLPLSEAGEQLYAGVWERFWAGQP